MYPNQHPVCRRVLDFIGAGKKGKDIREHFRSRTVWLAAGRHRRGALCHAGRW
jgi:hypothetical protein